MESLREPYPEVQGRQLVGHWQSDLVKGAGKASALGTLGDRNGRLVLLAKVDGVDTESVLEGFTRRLLTLPARLRKTLTQHQGREMASHADLTKRLNLWVYFADSHSPWQPLPNENTSALLRAYPPKGKDYSGLFQRYLKQVPSALNTRPNKYLSFLIPEEVGTNAIALTKRSRGVQYYDPTIPLRRYDLSAHCNFSMSDARLCRLYQPQKPGSCQDPAKSAWLPARGTSRRHTTAPNSLTGGLCAVAT